MLREAYDLGNLRWPESSLVTIKNTLQIKNQSSVHASENYRGKERYDCALVDVNKLAGPLKNTIPWVKIYKFFQTADELQWCLVAQAEWQTPEKRMCTAVWSPLITFNIDLPRVILPVEAIIQRVIPIPEALNSCTICWWLDSGQYKYPHEHRFKILTG